MRFLENARLSRFSFLEREREWRRRVFLPKSKREGAKGFYFLGVFSRVLPKIALIIPKKGPSSSFKKEGRVHDKIQRKNSLFFSNTKRR